MVTASGVRLGWQDLPAGVRGRVEGIVGATVVEAVSQRGGFSPGTADRLLLSDGRRAFAKAVSSAQNQHSPDVHRKEIRATAALPAQVPAPKLLGHHDDGDWVVLVLEDVPGRHPETPWRADELAGALSAVDTLATVGPVAGLPLARTTLVDTFLGWQRIAADPPAELDGWARAHLDELCAASTRMVASLAGETLAHVDLRADNLLVTPDGRVTIVDWPWACNGPVWLDTVLLLVNVNLFGGHDVDAILAERGYPDRTVTDGLIAATGYFLDAAREPDPPGLPTVRAFQRAQGDATLEWVRRRWHRTPAG